jgi:hypothetical protein
MEFPRTKEEIIWNFSLANEFTGPRQAGYTFVIDVFDNAAKLALYHIKMNYSKSTTLDMQPPKDLLEEALKEQNSSIHHGRSLSHQRKNSYLDRKYHVGLTQKR